MTSRQLARTKIVFLSFATLKKPRDADVIVKAAGKDLTAVRAELMTHVPAFDPTAGKDKTSQRK